MSKVPAINTQVQRQRASQFTSESAPGPLDQDNVALHKDTTLYEQDEQDDLDEEDEDDDDSTFTSSPSIPDENINFDLVYALHTFVATVEGQASVFKGDALTLLDDSNSYWWLVSVLKTSEVGYIPAENIETPFERLARLNKHRNVEVTAMDQAVHYIPQASKNSTATGSKMPKRRVTMNKDLNVQVQIILVGDDGEQQVGEAYEEWEESMVTECSDDDDDDDDDNDFESMDEKEQEQDDIGVHHDSLQHRASHQESSTTTATAASVSQQQSLPDSNTTTSSNSSTSSTSTPPNAISTPSTINNNNKQPTSGTTTTPVGSLWRLFSRGKKDNNIKPSSVIPARVSSEDADSGSVSSLASSVISEDRTAPRNHHATSSNNNNNQLAVLRVFAGNVNVGAMYHSMLVDENTSAEQLLIQAMERFHIAQIENKASGGGRSSSRTITPTNGSGVEYYLTVKPMNGDEVTLAPQDKPLAIFRSMTDQLTTPMPSLAHVKKFSQQFASSTSSTDSRRSTLLHQRQQQHGSGEDSIIRFYLHKRIRRVNEREGQVYVKVSLYTNNTNKQGTTATSNNNNSSSIPSAFSAAKSLRRKKVEPSEAARERIDKLIAVSSTVTIADLTEIALDKFHIVPHGDNDHYRMAVSTQHTQEKSLNPSTKVIEVLHDDAPGSTRDNGEKLFTLRKMHGPSRSSSREGQQRSLQHALKTTTTSRVSNHQQGRSSPIPVTQLDTKIRDVLQRVDSALEQLGHDNNNNNNKRAGSSSNSSSSSSSPILAVARNPEGGVDMILAHGALISKPLARNQTQYSLLAKVPDEDRLCLAAQKVVQLPSQRAVSTQLKHVTEQDLDSLARFATTYIDTHDRSKISRKPLVATTSSATQGLNEDPNSAPSLDVLGGNGGQMSSMDDLEKEFQRIIAAHAF